MISYKNVVRENGGQNESIGNGLICIIWRMIVTYELATIEELQAVYDLVQQTNYQMIWICHWWKKNPMSIIRTH